MIRLDPAIAQEVPPYQVFAKGYEQSRRGLLITYEVWNGTLLHSDRALLADAKTRARHLDAAEAKHPLGDLRGDLDAALALLGSAVSEHHAARAADGGSEEGEGEKKTQAELLLDLAAGWDLFREDQTGYACVADQREEGTIRRTFPVRGRAAREWLRIAYLDAHGGQPSAEALQSAISTLEALAVFRGESRRVFRRVAELGESLWLDLGDPTWRAVRVDPQGWALVPSDRVPIHFVRGGAMLPLPEPARGGDLDALRSLINVRPDGPAWKLLIAWLLACLRPKGPYPLLLLTGGMGTGKSTAGLLLRSLLDPARAGLRSEPREERDLAIAATNGHIVAYDNLSSLPSWLSDALCRLSTGAGLGVRSHYENSEETIFEYERPCLLTSIEDVVTRGDLLDRCVLVELAPIDDTRRTTEAELWAAFDSLRPRVLGALLDVASAGLAALPHTRLPRTPRMGSFATWATACEGGLGWPAGSFLDAYNQSRAAATGQALEASPLVAPLRAFLEGRMDPWEGTASELLAALTATTTEEVRRGKKWPKDPARLVGTLKRLAPSLLADGIVYEAMERTKKTRLHRLALIETPTAERDGDAASPASPTSPTREKPGDAGEDRSVTAPLRSVTTSPAPGPGDAGTDPVTLAGRLASPPSQERGDAGDAGDATTQRVIAAPEENMRTALIAAPPAPVHDAAYTLITTPDGLAAALPALAASPLLCLDTETTGLDPHTARLRLLTLSTADHTFIVDTWKVPGWQGLVGPLLADPGRTIVGHNLRFDLGFLLAAGIECAAACFDTMLAAQLLEAGQSVDAGQQRPSYALAAVAPRYAGLEVAKGQQLSDWSKDTLNPEQLRYAALDAAVLHPLHARLSAEIDAAGLGRAWAIECGCLPALAAMAYAGMPFDRQRWLALSDAAVSEQYRTRQRLNALLATEGVNTFGGFTINYDSPAQVAALLGKLGVALPTLDSGQPDTSEAALSLVADRHPAIPVLLAYREAGKLAGTYGVTFVKDHLSTATGRIHADYRQLGAASGRMSCTRPNLQNIPRSRDYRACFRAPEGRALVKCDYTAIELRIASAIAPDPAMLAAFVDGADLHKRTAASVLGVPESEVTKEQRQLAKALNFGLIYGMGAKTLVGHARAGYGVALTMQEAEGHRARFFRTYPGLAAWHRRTGDTCSPETRTLAGRRRLDMATFTQRLNTPVQGSGADGLKAALGRLWRHRTEAPTARLVATVHDEIVAECPEGDAQAVAEWLQRHMVAAMGEIVAGAVPIETEATVARDWAGTPLSEGGSR